LTSTLNVAPEATDAAATAAANVAASAT